MPQIKSLAFGALEVDDQQYLHFPYGVYGLDHLRDFYLVDEVEPPFYLLQSAEDETIAFIVIQPEYFKKDYEIKISNQELADINLKQDSINDSEELLVLCIVTIPQDRPQEMTANLLGPLIINKREKIGKQALSLREDYTTKHFIMEEIDNSPPQKMASEG